MISPDLFSRLRAAQLRSVREQELLSGRNWILICAFAHVLALVYPVFLLLHVLILRSPYSGQVLHPATNIGITVLSGLVLVICWWWARYAPFRAALLALVAYLIIKLAHVMIDPGQLAVGTIFKTLVILGLLQAVLVAYRRRRPQ